MKFLLFTILLLISGCQSHNQYSSECEKFKTLQEFLNSDCYKR